MPPFEFMAALFGAIAIGIASGYYLRVIHALSKRSSVELELKEKLIEAEEKGLKLIEKAEAKAEEVKKENNKE